MEKLKKVVKKISNPKRMIKKVFAIFMLIFVGFLQVGQILTQSLYASEKTMSFNYTGTSEKVFINKNYDYNTSFRQATLDSYIAYCIDYGRALPESTMTYKRDLSAKATSVLVYGYPNRSVSELGVSNKKEAYLATQLAFWNVVKSTGDVKKGVLELKYSDLEALPGEEASFERVLVAAKKLEAYAKANPYNPAFSVAIDSSAATTTVQGDTVVVGPYKVQSTGFDADKKAKITLSGAPAGTIITDKNGNQTAKFTTGEAIYVKAPVSAGSASLTLNASLTGNQYTGVAYGTSVANVQDYAAVVDKTVSLDNSVKVAWNVTSEAKPGNIQLNKVDTNGNVVAGAKFQLINSKGEIVNEAITNASGVISFSGLTEGNYTVVETFVPSGYVLDSTPKSVKVTSGNTTPITIVNQIETINTPIEPAVPVHPTTPIEPAVPVRPGTPITPGVPVTPGIPVTPGVPVGLGSLKIKKVDDNGTPIANVTFNILDSDKNIIDTVVTGSDGTVKIEDILEGDYYYQEVSAPDNVVMDSEIHKFSITDENEDIEVTVENKLIKGTLKILKVDDSGNKVKGVKFEIYDKDMKLVDTIVTDKDGVAVSKELVKGKYYYKEVETPLNLIPDDNVYEFNITTDNEVVIKNVVNKLVKGGLIITKVDENGNKLSGVKFNILDEKKSKIKTIVTDENGIASLDGLELGKYYYQEIKAPDNVVLDSTVYPFEITTEKKVIEVEVVNKLIKGTLKILKVDDSGNKVKGVKFEIYDKDKNLVDTIVTDEEGVAISKELEKGKYYYKEVETPLNLIPDTNLYAFTISKDGEVVIKNIVNELVKGSIKIIKKDDLGNPLANVKFKILDSDKKVIETITTNDSGIAVSKDLPNGTYYYQEVSGPKTVLIDTNEYKLEINGDNIVELNIVNTLKRAKLQITKLDKANKQPLANVKFNILDSDKNVIETIVTNENGIAYSSDLTLGTYYYQEVEAPNGYVMDNKQHEFKIKEHNEDVKVTVYNVKKETLPVTGSMFNTNIMIILAVSVVTVSGYVVYTYAKKRKSNN